MPEYKPPSGIDAKKEEGYLSVLVATGVYNAMERDGVTKAELAKRLGCTESYVTQVLDGERNLNLNLRLISRLGVALNIQWGLTWKEAKPYVAQEK